MATKRWAGDLIEGCDGQQHGNGHALLPLLMPLKPIHLKHRCGRSNLRRCRPAPNGPSGYWDGRTDGQDDHFGAGIAASHRSLTSFQGNRLKLFWRSNSIQTERKRSEVKTKKNTNWYCHRPLIGNVERRSGWTFRKGSYMTEVRTILARRGGGIWELFSHI